MHLFVTGATGFVGSNFLLAAFRNGHTVTALRRPGSQTRLEISDRVRWIDAALDADLSHAFHDVDWVVHLAAHTPNPPYAPLDECLYWNVVASSRLVQAAAAAGVSNFLIAGTCFEYGAGAEGQDFIHPGSELRPTLTYPISKAAASIALLGLARHLGLKMQVLRIFQVFGEGEAQTRFWPSLRLAAREGHDFPMSSGIQIRDFVNVSEVAQRFIDALDFHGVEAGRPHTRNIGSGKAASLIEFAQGWWTAWDAKGRLQPGSLGLRPGEVSRLVPNITDTHIG